ncbi:MAG: toprim domain-containing protein [Alphaproteobacteria bacterium]|nr:toprim domain-containing protein [Alphaproteobacteria bacterium]
MTTASEIARALGLRRSGHDYVGQCPSCGYHSGFSITEKDGRLLVYCAAGGCTQPALWAALAKLGLIHDRHEQQRPKRRRYTVIKPKAPRIKTDAEIAEANEWKWAARLWQRSVPAVLPNGATTVVIDYLRSRGITIPIPADVLRFLPDCWHRESGTKALAMIALIEHPIHGHVAVHRTWLRADGGGKADLVPNKMTLGGYMGAAIRLAPIGPVLALAEGVETALSYMQLTGIPTWSAVSAPGIENLILPVDVREVIFAVDPDPVGIKAAEAAARRFARQGRIVSIARPPAGQDFNDILMARRAA